MRKVTKGLRTTEDWIYPVVMAQLTVTIETVLLKKSSDQEPDAGTSRAPGLMEALQHLPLENPLDTKVACLR